eukprot:Gregarina_sp_Pseudo_9__727@NODE_1464_length_1577_cov_19_295839_g1360_i0_p1_GENE_NODE_1464_length_1577_cov_19_295839_g1360_i0NODE_1464_length_1577_cov_19_295839_g1360_i0_p1_ORF_typecomplete_len372_score70_08ADH_N/PF08240_12/2_3e30ADH_zinc_N/PF00107_26/2_6e19ADH_zinc_N/PF00107_26/2_5e03Glu_dehyd_C/PF16912_5/2_8e16ADH_zinc_N_2/PF13602_6/8_1e06AlaDh_PNT_C/PF01262_21/1_7e052Hacid_dh_C/PF02826_19/4_1e05Shikimate_DH/PF01488_20/0_0018DZR/PF12773_7/0_073AdoHcyase_NAD/PF00670_21/0_074OCD_Mu_crystall/PF024
MVQASGWVSNGPKAPLEPWTFQIRDLRPDDVEIEVKFCGICHTDLHMMDNDWQCSQYPMVPGHEIAGVVARVGDKVKKFAVGDHAGVGYLAWTCRTCQHCVSGEENLCSKHVPSYGFSMPDGEITRGGFANKVIICEDFAARIPGSLDLKFAAPLLCAGITCWSPMKHFGFDRPGAKIGVVGLGGLGHMAVMFGHRFNNEVTVISTSSNKEALARSLGASHFVSLSRPEQIKHAVDSLDCIIDTVGADKPMNVYLSLLKANGVYVTVGLPDASIDLRVPPASLMKRRKIVGSLVGSIGEMEEMFRFCQVHQVHPMIEVVGVDEINLAIERLRRNDVKFRFVVDMMPQPTAPSVQPVTPTREESSSKIFLPT